MNNEISLRDYFAAMAMSGMLADPQVTVGGERSANLAEISYEVADAMIDERNKVQSK